MDAQAMMQLMGGNTQQDLRLKRQLELVKRLREQAEDNQGQMVSGHYVPRGILGALQNGMAAYTGVKADQQADAMAGEVDARQARDRGAFLDALRMGMRRNYPEPQSWLAPDGMEDR